MTQIKGIADIIDAFCGLDAPGWSLDVVGDGPLPSRRGSRRAFGLKDRIHSTDAGRTRRRSCFRRLLPLSLRSEGRLDALTALSAAFPVLASDIAAVRGDGTGERFDCPRGRRCVGESVAGGRFEGRTPDPVGRLRLADAGCEAAGDDDIL